MKKFYLLLSIIGLLTFSNKTQAANDSIYEKRRNAYIDTALAHPNNQSITLQAYRGVPVDTGTLNGILNSITTDGTIDFKIVQLMRVLYLSNGQYDTIIKRALDKVPFWLTNNEVLRDYWSENHMSQWITSDFLRHERYHMPFDARMDYRVRHYLRLKIQYGFYEFLSTDYNPYCLSGLLNLADFAQDAEVKSLATQAATRLLKDQLYTATNNGTTYPTAGRNYYGKYEEPYGQNYNNLIYLLTGFGEAPDGASHAGGFLASSSIPVDPIINSWTPSIDTTLIIGHTLDAGFVINDSLDPVDKVIFQWSSGAYFHPEVCQASAKLLSDSNMWNHTDFSTFSVFRLTPPDQFPALATSLSYASESSVICNDTVAIFKRNGVTLSSVRNFWPGKWGYEQIPCVANAGSSAVFTASGNILADFESRNATNENNDLPYVRQKSNVALLMYRPDINLPNIGQKHPEVSLHWIDSTFSEIRNDSLWLLGRQGGNYVGVRRGCLDVVNTLRACTTKNGQTWVIMVGDSTMYGSFDNFQAVIDSSKFSENWTLNSSTQQWTYSAQIIVDTISIAYDWKGDSTLVGKTTAVEDIVAANQSLHIYPNPATNQVKVDLSAFANQAVTLRVVNMLGQELYHETLTDAGFSQKVINTNSWADGVYLISVETTNELVTEKLVKKQ